MEIFFFFAAGKFCSCCFKPPAISDLSANRRREAGVFPVGDPATSLFGGGRGEGRRFWGAGLAGLKIRIRLGLCGFGAEYKSGKIRASNPALRGRFKAFALPIFWRPRL